MVECGDGSYYTGSTHNLLRRIHEHSKGRGARYTKKHLPIKLVYCEHFENLSEARKWENVIKRLDHENKRKLALKETNREILQNPHNEFIGK